MTRVAVVAILVFVFIAAPLAAEAQPAVPRIGVVAGGFPNDDLCLDAARHGLNYPVELGVIASLAHPGGNVTGVTHLTPELMAKRVQLLKEIVPTASRFAVLRIPGRVNDLVVRDMESAA